MPEGSNNRPCGPSIPFFSSIWPRWRCRLGKQIASDFLHAPASAQVFNPLDGPLVFVWGWGFPFPHIPETDASLGQLILIELIYFFPLRSVFPTFSSSASVGRWHVRVLGVASVLLLYFSCSASSGRLPKLINVVLWACCERESWRTNRRTEYRPRPTPR